ncbi:histone-lysine N-methyltransferase SETMAR-like [Pogonomyrmex barbatus]|uniref:Histone-lysine N-methyltransferase SETMAR-like n=1 Tax=Pogonomyrmex barbatus TaxID=144034 RepID=A0A6I9WFE0_9HYME|nr:histone-lysine N-methyltransferase SETMAR-like [Pogonomyrmex barbatus]
MFHKKCQRWFTKFRTSDFDLNDAPRSERLTEVDDDKIKALIESKPRYTTREIAETLNIHYSSVHLKKLGYQLIIGDEKWIVYNNTVHKRSWSQRDDSPQMTLKANIHQRKIMLSV